MPVSTAASMLEVRGLNGGWGETTVVENLDLTIADGESVALIGRNGVGKTTTLEMIPGAPSVIPAPSVSDGEDLSPAPTFARSRAGIGYVPQEREVFGSLTVRENLRWRAGRGAGPRSGCLRCFRCSPNGLPV